MEPKAGLNVPAANCGLAIATDAKIDGNKMAGYLLSGPRKTIFTVILKKLNGGLIGTADSKGSPIQMQNRELFEPSSCTGRIKCFSTFKNINKNILNFTSSHTTILM